MGGGGGGSENVWGYEDFKGLFKVKVQNEEYFWGYAKISIIFWICLIFLGDKQ